MYRGRFGSLGVWCHRSMLRRIRFLFGQLECPSRGSVLLPLLEFMSHTDCFSDYSRTGSGFCEPQQASSKSLHSDFSLELHSLLMARRLNTAGGDLKSCLDDEARAKCQNSLTESVSLFECHLLPPIERSHSLSQVQHSKVYPNVQELSPMSKVAEQWTMSKDTRRKNRRPPKKGFIAPLSHPLSNEYSVEIVVPIALKVRGGRDDDNKTITDCNELKRRPSLSSVLPGSSPGGSLLCPTSSSEAEESFLKDYW